VMRISWECSPTSELGEWRFEKEQPLAWMLRAVLRWRRAWHARLWPLCRCTTVSIDAEGTSPF
jgi:hypothetical protein